MKHKKLTKEMISKMSYTEIFAAMRNEQEKQEYYCVIRASIFLFIGILLGVVLEYVLMTV